MVLRMLAMAEKMVVKRLAMAETIELRHDATAVFASASMVVQRESRIEPGLVLFCVQLQSSRCNVQECVKMAR